MLKQALQVIENHGYKIREPLISGGIGKVFIASYNGHKCVVKFPDPNPRLILKPGLDERVLVPYEYKVNHILTEMAVHERTKDVDGIAHVLDIIKLPVPRKSIFMHHILHKFSGGLREDFEGWLPEDYKVFAMVKEYIPGKHMEHGEKIIGKRNQGVIIGALAAMHGYFIAGLDWHPGNIVRTAPGTPHLVDPGATLFEKGQPHFSSYVESDMKNLEYFL